MTEFITDGKRNVLPGETILKGDVRTRHPDDRLKIETYLNQISSGLASAHDVDICLLYTSPSPRDKRQSRMPSSA